LPGERTAIWYCRKNYTSALAFEDHNSYVKDIDRYGRTIAIVHLPAGRILNEELIKHGYAWHYKKYDNNPAWARYEQEARAGKRGCGQIRTR
jgi:micrococcal nuclease